MFTAATNLSGILTDSTQFMQYRVILQSAEFAGTPVLNDVVVSYSTYVSIGDSNAGEVTAGVLHLLPTHHSATLRFRYLYLILKWSTWFCMIFQGVLLAAVHRNCLVVHTLFLSTTWQRVFTSAQCTGTISLQQSEWLF